MANELTIYQSVIADVKGIIFSGMESAYNATSRAMVLTKEYGKSYPRRNLQYFRKFYQCFPDIEIVNSCVHNLTSTHFRSLLRVSDEGIVRYSVLHDNDRLFLSKYLTYLPTKGQLKQKIERKKAVFYMQHPQQTEEGGEDA